LTADRDKPFTLQELYTAVEATAPITPTGARVVAKEGEIVLDPSTVELHGDGIRVDCYPTGLDIGYWNDWQNWVSWSIPQMTPGDYRAFARTCSPDGVRDFRVQIAGQSFTGSTTKSKAWDQYKDVELGVVHIESATDIPVEFHPADAEHWGPTNLAVIKLVPTTRPAQ
jgi:hypothetical protein